MVQEGDGGRRDGSDSARQAKQAQPAVPTETAVCWQAAPAGGEPWALNRTPVAPPWRRDRRLEKAAKK
jgi:hypothetical protein